MSLTLILILLSIFCEPTWTQTNVLYDDDPCTFLDNSSAIGKCTAFKMCPTAIKALHKGKKPQLCSFDGNTPIICCESNNLEQRFGADKIGSKSEEKCNEYKNITRNGVLISTLIVSLIVGGTSAKKGEFPHMAAIGWTQFNGEITWNCAASIISEKWLISAAHCRIYESYKPDIARLGTKSLSNPDAGYVDYKIIDLVTPPNFTIRSKYHDLLLIRVDRTIEFHTNLRPACLWHENTLSASNAVASGWGKTGLDEATSDVLRKVSLKIMDNSVCKKVYPPERKLKDGVINSQLCSGVLKGGKDTCQGDSGGPLLITKSDNQCIYYIIGVTSFGSGCGIKNTPGLYTRVSSYIDWIESIVWN